MRADGAVSLDGTVGSIHRIGALAQGLEACNGWTFWHVETPKGLSQSMNSALLSAPRWPKPQNNAAQAAITSASSSSERFAKASMFANLSALPVRSVMARSIGPATAMQVCPAGSP